MKVGTVSKVMLGGNADVSTKSGIIIDADVILGKAEGRTKDLKGLVLSNKVMFGKSVSRAKMATVSGVAPLVLADAISANVVELIAFGGTEQRNLPAEYTQLDYIESSGTQYINTGVAVKANTRVRAEFEFTSSTSSTRRLFGKIAGASTGAMNYREYSSFYWFQSNTTTTSSASKHLIEFQTDDNVYLDGAIIGTKGTFSGGSDLPIYLFAELSDGSNINYGSVKVYRFTIFEGTTIVKDLFPCKRVSDNVLGMYDTVSGSFLTNDGTGTFTAGNVLPTPDNPLPVVSNNGVLKYSANMANVNAQTALIGYYISATGVVTADANNWMYQDYIPVSPNTTYTITMSSPVYFVSISEYSTASDSGFVIRKAGSTGTNTSLTITTGATTNFIRFGTNIDRTEITLEEVLAINWQLNKGNSMPYTPYVAGGIYTDGTVETINIHGKNLFDKNHLPERIYAYFSSSGTTWTYTSGGYSLRFPCLPNTTYTIRYNGNSSQAVLSFASASTDDVPTSSQGTVTVTRAIRQNSPTINTPITLTTGANDKWLIVQYNAADPQNTDMANNLQIEIGSTATTYEPYISGGTATAEMLLKVGGYQDQQEIIDGTITREIGIKVFDGTEEWKTSVTSKFYLDTNYMRNYNSMPVFCTHYKAVLASGTSGVGYGEIGLFATGTQGSSPARLVIGDDNYTSVGDFKVFLANQYAAGTPVIVVYPLATATTETVTGQPMTTTQGTNIAEITQASLDGLELSVTYMAGVDATVEEIEDAQLSPDVDVTIS